MNEYVIINKTATLKEIEELETGIKTISLTAEFINLGRILALKQILSQSTPLIPEIEKAFDAGHNLSGRANFRKGTKEYESHINKKDYISNLKLDI